MEGRERERAHPPSEGPIRLQTRRTSSCRRQTLVLGFLSNEIGLLFNNTQVKQTLCEPEAPEAPGEQDEDEDEDEDEGVRTFKRDGHKVNAYYSMSKMTKTKRKCVFQMCIYVYNLIFSYACGRCPACLCVCLCFMFAV